MNFSHVTTKLFEFFTRLSGDYGTGDVVNDFVIAVLLIILLLILLSVVGKMFAGSAAQQSAGFERTGAALGRLEKVEMTLNSLKTEFLRYGQTAAADLGYIKHELSELRRMISGQGTLDMPEPTGTSGGYTQADDSRYDPNYEHYEGEPGQDQEKKN